MNRFNVIGIWFVLALVGLCNLEGCSQNSTAVSKPSESTPAGKQVSFSGCKKKSKVFSKAVSTSNDCIEYTYDQNSTLYFTHINSVFNCCVSSVSADITIEESIIRIQEKETLENGGCYCLCLSDVSYEISNLLPGVYQILLSQLYLNPDDELLQFTVDLSSSPSGRYCVDRGHYPWAQ